MTTCYVPVLPYKQDTKPTHFFGYDQGASMPYIMETTLAYYYVQTAGTVADIEGMVFAGDVLVHPFALYSNEVSARLALDQMIALRIAA